MKFKNVMFAMALALAFSCGSKDAKKDGETTDSTGTETPAVVEKPATAKEMIAKDWVLDNVDYEGAIASFKDDKEKAEFKTMMEEMVPPMKTKTEFIFEADGKATVTVMSPDKSFKTRKGTWVLSADEKTVTITAENEPIAFGIEELSADKLSLKQGQLIMMYVPKK
ncbi:lipocalin family protein [Flavobacterium sp.]|uniref:lipocalin family protein n=1 Tax=Flavobacterium sp. TaxID=239 RepID=UPI0012083047|nr:lipocalin family protein [Flavobacterium sp.]RZJ69864.1 MAG: hypothetical protein EOO49_15645 [Flavobacterium sp.]